MAANGSLRRKPKGAVPGLQKPLSTSHSTQTPEHSPSEAMSVSPSIPPETAPKKPSPVLSRKYSTPMMPPFMVSAPGKVIVYGEHAVVHGKPAIAAAISLRSYLLVSFLSKSHRTVTLRFPDIQLEHSWDLDELPWDAFSAPGKKKYYYDLVTSLDPDLMKALQPHILAVSPHLPEAQRKIHQSSASAFLYLFLSLANRRTSPCVYTLRSTIPIGAGLGSSASISVCLSCALLLQIRALSGPHQDQPGKESELQIERINRWAFVGELCIHGNPSGVDNTVASRGKAVLFQRKKDHEPPSVTPLHSFPELPLLLVNTRQSRSTKVEVAKVARLKQELPIITENILDAIGHITQSAHELITSPDFKPDDPAALKRLGDLVTVNHGLLVALGVSHPKLERIREIIDHTGIGWTKLTGAGGGGCAITILKPQVPAHTESNGKSNGQSNGNGTRHLEFSSDETEGTSDDGYAASVVSRGTKRKHRILDTLEIALENEGFEKFETTLAGDGVGVLWPAVLHNGNEEEGGEEIDQEKFLRAEGNDGIERLVGVSSSRRTRVKQVREGWKFWRPWLGEDREA